MQGAVLLPCCGPARRQRHLLAVLLQTIFTCSHNRRPLLCTHSRGGHLSQKTGSDVVLKAAMSGSGRCKFLTLCTLPPCDQINAINARSAGLHFLYCLPRTHGVGVLRFSLCVRLTPDGIQTVTGNTFTNKWWLCTPPPPTPLPPLPEIQLDL